MKKMILTTLVVLFLSAMLLSPVSSATEAVVDVTVSTEIIAIALADGAPNTIDYGTLTAGVGDAIPNNPNDPTVQFKNTGNVTEKFYLKGADATSGTNTWTLASTTGVDQYVHKWATATLSSVTPLTKFETDTLIDTVLPGDTTTGTKFRLSTPTVISNPGSYSTTITAVAVKQ